MDFLDPRKQRAHMIRLLVGYGLIAVALLFSVYLLLYQAYGFGINRDGQVIQKGLVFMSSQPANATIYLNGKQFSSTTNTKTQLEAGSYKLEMQREGYRSWQRLITVLGGDVLHFDYPMLFPTTLRPTEVKAYTQAPGLVTQSPDRRWLIAQSAASLTNFEVFDLANPKQVTTAAVNIELPTDLMTTAKATAHSYKVVEWSTDNRHLIFQHDFTLEGAAGPSSEYLSIDRTTPASSVNLTKTLGLTPTKVISLFDKKFDRYYVYDNEAKTLGTMTLDGGTTVTPVLDHVLAYKSYGADQILYVSDRDSAAKPAPAGQVYSLLYDNGQSYTLRDHAAKPPYLIDMAQYQNDWYVAVGASGDSKVYVYKNPEKLRKASTTTPIVPVNILRVGQPNYLEFSANTQLIMVSSGTNIAVYDADADKGYNFVSKYPLDPPETHPSWMDGHRLTYVSSGKVVVFDYDNINDQTLMASSPSYQPYFDRNFDYVYTLVPTAAGGATLTSTSLLTPADQ